MWQVSLLFALQVLDLTHYSQQHIIPVWLDSFPSLFNGFCLYRTWVHQKDSCFTPQSLFDSIFVVFPSCFIQPCYKIWQYSRVPLFCFIPFPLRYKLFQNLNWIRAKPMSMSQKSVAKIRASGSGMDSIHSCVGLHGWVILGHLLLEDRS